MPLGCVRNRGSHVVEGAHSWLQAVDPQYSIARQHAEGTTPTAPTRVQALRPIRNVPRVALLPYLVQVSASSALTRAKKLDRSVSATSPPLTGIFLRVYDIHPPHSPWHTLSGQ